MPTNPTAADATTGRRRRSLLLGGLLVPAVLTGAGVPALSAAADAPVVTIGSKAALVTAVAQATPVSTTWRLATDAVAVDTPHDSVALPAGAQGTIDLAGHHLSLDTISLGTGSTLHVVDSVAGGELDVDGVAPTTVPTYSAGIGLASSAVLQIVNASVHAAGGIGAAGIGTPSASTVTGAVVDVEGTARVLASGGTGGAGIGGGLLGGGVSVTIGGSATVTAHSGGVSSAITPSAIGNGVNGVGFGALSIGPAATLVIPVDSVLRIPANAQVLNNGVVDLQGAALGGGVLQNAGDVLTTNGSLAALVSGVTVAGNHAVTTVTTDLGSGTGVSIPATTQVMGQNLLQLPAWVPVRTGSVFTGWALGDGTAVTAASDLVGVAQSGLVALTAQWAVPISIGSGNSFTFPTGQAVSVQLPITGTSPSVSVLSGTLPAGLSLSNVGLLSGTPVSAGVSDIVVAVAGPAQPVIDHAWEIVVQDVATGTGSNSTSNSNTSSNSGTSSNSNTSSNSSSSTSSTNSSGSGNSTSAGSGNDSSTTSGPSSTSNSTNSTSSSSTNSSSNSSSTNSTTDSDSGNSSSNTANTTNNSSSNTSSSSSSTSNSTTTDPSSTGLGLVAAKSVLAGYNHSLSVSLKSAAKVSAKYSLTGRLPKGVKFDTRSAKLTGSPKEVGKFSFSIRAVSAKGTVLRKYSIVVPKVVSFGHSVSTLTPATGGTVTVHVTKLSIGQRFTLTIGKRVVGRGVAKRAGTVKAVVHLPKSLVDRAYQIRITLSGKAASAAQSRVDSIDLTAVTAHKHLTTTVRNGALTVTGLAAHERVRLTIAGAVVASGTADASGVFVDRHVKAGKTVQVQGATTGRTALCTVE